MNENVELLNYIFQNSQMGVDTIKQLLDIVEDLEFKCQLQSQYDEYKEINETAKNLLNTNGYDEKGISAFEKIKTYLMINMQTLTDKSTSHVAEMMIIGSTMGVIDAIKNIKKYRDAELEIINLMEKLKAFEEYNITSLKAFLQEETIKAAATQLAVFIVLSNNCSNYFVWIEKVQKKLMPSNLIDFRQFASAFFSIISSVTEEQ